MFRYFLLFILAIPGIKTQAQEVYTLQPSKIKLGKIDNWKNDTLWFELANTGDRPWFILPQHYGREFQLIYSRQTIQPGYAARVGVIYYTEVEGSFKLKIPVYLNLINEPIELMVSGNIRSIDPEALVQCPTVNRPPTLQPTTVLAKSEENREVKATEEEEEEEEVDNYAFEEIFVEEETPAFAEQESVAETMDDPDAFAPNAPANNIVLLLDKSRSMGSGGKMEALKSSIGKLIDALRPQDQITIITYSRVVKIPLLADDNASKDRMHQIVDELNAVGGSYGGKGMMKAFDLAKKYRLTEGNNAIILATDGKFNDREITEEDLFKKARHHSRRGIKVSGLAFGNDPRAVDFIQELADNGKGECIQVQEVSDSERMILQLVKDLSSAK